MLLLALDDTDTLTRGCTTHAAYRLAQAIEDAGGPLRGWGLAAPARLVRLNPAAEHKTRGNGALVLPLARREPAAVKTRIGTRSDGQALFVPTDLPRRETSVSSETEKALQRIVMDLLPEPGNGENDPQPAAILLAQTPAARLYEEAVTTTLTAEAAWRNAPPGTLRLTPEGRRGEIGALAAAAWPADASAPSSSAGRWSWEYVAYRNPDDSRRERDLPPDFSARLDALPGGFDNVDTASGRLRAVPRTPCPVRFAARGLDPLALVGHLDPLSAPTGGWLLLTNQATGDPARWASPRRGPFRVIHAPVTITGPGKRHDGGHLFVPGRLADQAVTLAAYEPTKTLRDALEATTAGDRLTVLGRTGGDPDTIALEALRVDRLAPRSDPGSNPRCPQCQSATKSRGRDAGYRCPHCRTRVPEEHRVRIPVSSAPLYEGARFQVPNAVRGHLLPPLDGLPAPVDLKGRPGASIPPALQGSVCARPEEMAKNPVAG